MRLNDEFISQSITIANSNAFDSICRLPFLSILVIFLWIVVPLSVVSCSFRTMSNFFRPFWAKTAFFGTDGDKNILDRPLFILNGIAIKPNSI